MGGGSGKEKQTCLKLAGNLGERVKVRGPVSQRELAAIMKQSHIFILPSFYEGLPLVVLEALACGCRVIATSLPGVNEVLEKFKTTFISLVPTPRLTGVDTPVAEDEKTFENNLQDALEAQISAATGRPQIDLSPITAQLASFTWAGVFGRVRRVYFEALNSFEKR